MADGQWRYIAQRMAGDGALGEFIDFDLPLQGPALEEVLSGHNGFTATITPEYGRLVAPDGRLLLEENGTAIWAESPDGEIRGGGLLTFSRFTGPTWTLECTDISGVTVDLPYTESRSFINVDPIDMHREIWRYIQSFPGHNFGMTIDGTTSPIRIGTDLIQRVEFDLEPDASAGLDTDPVPVPAAPNRYANNAAWRAQGVKVMSGVGWNKDVVDEALGKWLNKDSAVAANRWKPLTDKEQKIRDKTIEKIGYPPNPPNGTYKSATATVVDDGFTLGGAGVVEPGTDPAQPVYDADPYRLAWYKDHNLASNIDDLAASTPYDWHVQHRWNGDEITHHMRIGYPRLGRRRTEERFVIGENIHVDPEVTRDGSYWASEVLVLGAGEGAAMVRGHAFRRVDGKVRKVAVVSDPSIQTDADAARRAEQELASRIVSDDITDIQLLDHPHAPMGSVDLGDEILLEGETGWVDLEVWVRVIARRISPDDGDVMGLTVIRSDRIG